MEGTVVPETRYAQSGDLSIAYQVSGTDAMDVVVGPGFVSNVELRWEIPVFRATAERLERSRAS